VYGGGKGDEDINVNSEHTIIKLKVVSLYNFMLLIEPFKHKGHCVVMDSVYMGDTMCQVGREEWLVLIWWEMFNRHVQVPAVWGRLLSRKRRLRRIYCCTHQEKL
jgi:hypothetical protein